MSKGTEEGIRIEDVEPAVFKELLYFIYTGDAPVSLLEEVTARHISMAQHLLSAADCYGLERLRLL